MHVWCYARVVHEHRFASIVGMDEAVPILAIEPRFEDSHTLPYSGSQ
jgi:hypothetical protein